MKRIIQNIVLFVIEPILLLGLVISLGVNVINIQNLNTDADVFFRAGHYETRDGKYVTNHGVLDVREITLEEYQDSNGVNAVMNSMLKKEPGRYFTVDFQIKKDGILEPYHFYGLHDYTAETPGFRRQVYSDWLGDLIVPPSHNRDYYEVSISGGGSYYLYPCE